MSILVATLVRDERSRYLEGALNVWKQFADEILALDDGSTDGTVELLLRHNVTLHQRKGEPAWGRESQARAELWRLARATNHDWIMILDADMIPADDPRDLMHFSADGVAFTLYDIWSLNPLAYRSDTHWQAHRYHRLWAVHRKAGGSSFNARDIHTYHFPTDLALTRVVLAPPSHALLHYGYATEADRLRAHSRYTSVAHLLTPAELAHANSILSAPTLTPMRTPRWTLTRSS